MLIEETGPNSIYKLYVQNIQGHSCENPHLMGSQLRCLREHVWNPQGSNGFGPCSSKLSMIFDWDTACQHLRLVQCYSILVRTDTECIGHISRDQSPGKCPATIKISTDKTQTANLTVCAKSCLCSTAGAACNRLGFGGARFGSGKNILDLGGWDFDL